MQTNQPNQISWKEQTAANLLQHGKLKQAEVIYKGLLNSAIANQIVYINLATIYGITSRWHEIIKLLNKFPQLRSNHSGALNILGVAFKEVGNLNAAIASYKKALKLKPYFAAAYYNLGNALKAQGKSIAAIASYNIALQLNRNFPEASYNLGIAHKEQGNLNAAILFYKRTIKLKPNHPNTYNNLGSTLKAQGKLVAAISSYRYELESHPLNAAAHNNLGVALVEKGEHMNSIDSYNNALNLKPNVPEFHCNLGNTLKEQGNLKSAISCYRKAIELKPNYPEVYNNLGSINMKQGNLQTAIYCYERAIKLKPNYPEFYYNLGIVLKEQGKLNAAICSYEKAIQIKPNFVAAQVNLSHTYLLAGNYKRGWHLYDHRTIKPDALPKSKRWDGSPLQYGEKLLLVSEQGLGDTLQFMRYALHLKQKGVEISLCVPPKLHGIIKASGIHPGPLLPEEANNISKGKWLPLLSLPKHLGVRPTNPIITEPYISTTNEMISKWSNILSGEKRPIIGINWQGNPNHELTNSTGRSLPLEAIAPIIQKTNANLLSLQKDIGAEQLETCSFRDRFVSCQEHINQTWDFLETAAIIEICDLVITSDTSIAHLAGGLGKTTWLLLKKVPEWRWGMHGDKTFWYPSMRLFRQQEKGHWDEVLNQVAQELMLLSEVNRNEHPQSLHTC